MPLTLHTSSCLPFSNNQFDNFYRHVAQIKALHLFLYCIITNQQSCEGWYAGPYQKHMLSSLSGLQLRRRGSYRSLKYLLAEGKLSSDICGAYMAFKLMSENNIHMKYLLAFKTSDCTELDCDERKY